MYSYFLKHATNLQQNAYPMILNINLYERQNSYYPFKRILLIFEGKIYRSTIDKQPHKTIGSIRFKYKSLYFPPRFYFFIQCSPFVLGKYENPFYLWIFYDCAIFLSKPLFLCSAVCFNSSGLVLVVFFNPLTRVSCIHQRQMRGHMACVIFKNVISQMR